MIDANITSIVAENENAIIQLEIGKYERFSRDKILAYLSDFEEVFNGKIIKIEEKLSVYKYKIKFENCKNFCQIADGILKIKIPELDDELYCSIYSFNYIEYLEIGNERVTCYFENDDNLFNYSERFEIALKSNNSNRLFNLLDEMILYDKESLDLYLEIAYENGYRFTPEQIQKFVYSIDEDLLSKLVVNASKAYTFYEIISLYPFVKKVTINEICNKSGIDLYDNYDAVLKAFYSIEKIDNKKATEFIENAHEKGLRFTTMQIVILSQVLPAELIIRLALNALGVFTKDQLNNLRLNVGNNEFKLLLYRLNTNCDNKKTVQKKEYRLLEGDSVKNLICNNGYDYSWFKIDLKDWSLCFTSNTDSLYAEFKFVYISNEGNILDDLKFYITNINGSIISSDSYLVSYGPIPQKIDIRMDGEKHSLMYGPCFPIKSDDSQIVDGISLNFSFVDRKRKFIIRKTYIYRNKMWYDEEFLALPL